MEYKVSTLWCGWWGGYGSTEAIARHLQMETMNGWRLVDMEVRSRWFILLLPRPKALFVFEREVSS